MATEKMVRNVLDATRRILTKCSIKDMAGPVANEVAAFPKTPSNDIGGWQAANESMTSLNILAPNDTVEQLVAALSAGFPNVASNDMEVDEIMGFLSAAPDDTTEQLLVSKFIVSPSQETLNGIVSDFIDTTSNNALKTLACGSCV